MNQKIERQLKNREPIINLRNLGLEEKDIIEITNYLEIENDCSYIKAISFSFNKNIGDLGAGILAEKLPLTIQEVGLVACGIGDKGGAKMLQWMRKCRALKMICIEQNNFSNNLEVALESFKKEHPSTMVVY